MLKITLYLAEIATFLNAVRKLAIRLTVFVDNKAIGNGFWLNG